MLAGGNVFSTRCQNRLRAEHHRQVGRKLALTYTGRDLVVKSITNITVPRQPEIYRAPLDWIRFNFTEVRIFIPDNRSNNVFREALITKCPSDKFDLMDNLDSDHIIDARCVRVLIRLIFSFLGQNKSQQMYKPAEVDLRYKFERM